MNFGEVIKEEILSKPAKDRCCKKAFLVGLIRGTGELYIKDDQLGLDFSIYNEEMAMLVVSYFKNLFGYEIREISVKEDKLNKRERFTLSLCGEEVTDILKDIEILSEADDELAVNLKFYNKITEKECCLKAFLRGLFVATGTCTVPSSDEYGKGGYHLEMVFSHYTPALDTHDILAKHGVNTNIIKRKESYVVYIKSVEEIKNLVAFLGLPKSVLQLMQLIINRELSNNSNRQKNCDLGNVSRQIEATAKQIDAINKIKEKFGLESLKKDLYDTAIARLNFENDSLIELSERLNVTKSCLNHRLRKIVDIAKSI